MCDLNFSSKIHCPFSLNFALSAVCNVRGISVDHRLSLSFRKWVESRRAGLRMASAHAGWSCAHRRQDAGIWPAGRTGTLRHFDL